MTGPSTSTELPSLSLIHALARERLHEGFRTFDGLGMKNGTTLGFAAAVLALLGSSDWLVGHWDWYMTGGVALVSASIACAGAGATVRSLRIDPDVAGLRQKYLTSVEETTLLAVLDNTLASIDANSRTLQKVATLTKAAVACLGTGVLLIVSGVAWTNWCDLW